MRRAPVIAALVLAATVGLAGPALAHTALVSSDPSDGARFDTAPSAVTLTFTEPIQDGGTNQIAVTGPDGGQWTEGQVDVRDNVVTARLRPLGPAGGYTVGYRVLSADGHPVSDTIRFELTKTGTGTATSAPALVTTATGTATAAESDNATAGVPIWVWVAGAGVLLVAGLGLALRMGRHNS
jgi:methionine-rich copper-binding protein CopC